MALWRLVPIVPCWGAVLCAVGGFRASSAYPLVPPAPPLRCDGQKRLQTPPGGSVVLVENHCPEPVGSWNPAASMPPVLGGLSLSLRLGTGEPPPPPPLGLSHHRGDVRSRALQVQGTGSRRPLLGWGGVRACDRGVSLGRGASGPRPVFSPVTAASDLGPWPRAPVSPLDPSPPRPPGCSSRLATTQSCAMATAGRPCTPRPTGAWRMPAACWRSTVGAWTR